MPEVSPLPAIFEALRSGATARAEELSRDALERSPDKPDILFLMALSLHTQRKLDQAVPFYRGLTELQPDSAVHWSNYAAALTDTGNLEEAERGFRCAIELNANDVDNRVQLGRLRFPLRRGTAKSYCASSDLREKPCPYSMSGAPIMAVPTSWQRCEGPFVESDELLYINAACQC